MSFLTTTNIMSSPCSGVAAFGKSANFQVSGVPGWFTSKTRKCMTFACLHLLQLCLEYCRLFFCRHGVSYLGHKYCNNSYI